MLECKKMLEMGLAQVENREMYATAASFSVSQDIDGKELLNMVEKYNMIRKLDI